MGLCSTLRRCILTKLFNVKKWKNVIIDILVILILPVPIVLMTCKKGESWAAEKGFEAGGQCPPESLLSPISTVNRRIVASYPLGESVRYVGRLGLVQFDDTDKHPQRPVIVTAASYDYYSYVVGLIERLARNMSPRLKIVVFDIGMTQEQKLKVCENKVCSVRRFPFGQFPAYLGDYLSSTAWKPVLIQLALQEFGFIIWMDSAVYLYDGNLQAGIDLARTHGIAAGHKRVTFPDINLAFETDNNTFISLGEEPCAFKNTFRFNAALIFIKQSPFTSKYIMRPWVSCALTKACIVAYRKSKCLGANEYGYCHRFDQSVLSIILNRLFYTNLTDIDLQDKVRWTKCYKKGGDTVYNEMVFLGKTEDVMECPELDDLNNTL